MASTSSSHSEGWSLRLRDAIARGDEAVSLPLRPLDAPAAFPDIETGGCLSDVGRYGWELVVPAGTAVSQVSVSINDELPIACQPGPGHDDGNGRWAVPLASARLEEKPFRLSFGFVTLLVEAGLADGTSVALRTREVPCSCRWPEQTFAVRGMLDEISSADRSLPIQWMVGTAAGESQGGILEGGPVTLGDRSLRAFIGLAEKVLSTFEANLSLFRFRPHSRTLPRESMVRAKSIVRVGRSEVQWMTLHADDYPPRTVRTTALHRSLDNAENRAVLLFLQEVESVMERRLRELASRLASMEELRQSLGGLASGDGMVPSLVIAGIAIDLERPLAERLKALKARSRRVRMQYEDALGKVPRASFRMPRRSKVFQEVPHYAALWHAMSDWVEFGEFDMARDALLLGTYRMDRLYEYYVLFRLLDELRLAGFSPADGTTCADTVPYTLASWYYQPETQVANRYRLVRGSTSVTLYYQPVIYGDAREEGGIRLHRTTPAAAFLAHSRDSYWTPDYLLVVSDGTRARHFVLDAKFSRPVDVAEAKDGASTFEKCLLKYRIQTRLADGSGVDGMWLLCGRTASAELLPYHTSSWGLATATGPDDGIAGIAPGASAAHELLGRLGLVREEPADAAIPDPAEGDPGDAGDAAQHPAKRVDDAPAGIAPTDGTQPGAKQEIDPDLLEDIRTLWSSLTRDERRNVERYSQRVLRLRQPLVRDKRPKNKSARSYTSVPYAMGKEELYVLTQWSPASLAILRSKVRGLRRQQ